MAVLNEAMLFLYTKCAENITLKLEIFQVRLLYSIICKIMSFQLVRAYFNKLGYFYKKGASREVF